MAFSTEREERLNCGSPSENLLTEKIWLWPFHLRVTINKSLRNLFLSVQTKIKTITIGCPQGLVISALQKIAQAPLSEALLAKTSFSIPLPPIPKGFAQLWVQGYLECQRILTLATGFLFIYF